MPSCDYTRGLFKLCSRWGILFSKPCGEGLSLQLPCSPTPARSRAALLAPLVTTIERPISHGDLSKRLLKEVAEHMIQANQAAYPTLGDNVEALGLFCFLYSLDSHLVSIFTMGTHPSRYRQQEPQLICRDLYLLFLKVKTQNYWETWWVMVALLFFSIMFETLEL